MLVSVKTHPQTWNSVQKANDKCVAGVDCTSCAMGSWQVVDAQCLATALCCRFKNGSSVHPVAQSLSIFLQPCALVPLPPLPALSGAAQPLLLEAPAAAAVPLGSGVPLWPHVVRVAPGPSVGHALQVGWWECLLFMQVFVSPITCKCLCRCMCAYRGWVYVLMTHNRMLTHGPLCPVQ